MIHHAGYTLQCDAPKCDGIYKSNAASERTAIDHARLTGWAVVHVRVTKGAKKSHIRTVRRLFCPYCKHVVGL